MTVCPTEGFVCICITCACAQSFSCVQLCDSRDYRQPGSSVHGIFQAGKLEWVAISSSRLFVCMYKIRVSLVAQMVKRLSAMQETRVRSLGWEDPLEKEMAAHSSILAWKIPWPAEPGRLPSMGSQRVRHD